MPVLGRDFGPDDLIPLLDAAQIDRSILVQAAWTTAETEYMLGLTHATDRIAGVVGWIDFENPAQADQLSAFAGCSKFLGARPMVQELPEDSWLYRDDITWAFEELVKHDLIFEALGFAKHAKPFLDRLVRHPDLRVVINHGMKPEIADGNFSDWAKTMSLIARETGAYCKLSGLLTEAKPGAGAADLRPYADHLLNEFGPGRIMWGSDWPVLLMANSYANWVGIAEELTAELSEDQRAQVWGETAQKFYRL